MTLPNQPYKVIMKAVPRFPYIGLVWARSKTQACNLFAAYLGEKGYSRARTSPASYKTLEVNPKKAIKLKYPIMINKPVSEEKESKDE